MKCRHCGSEDWQMSSPSYAHSPAQYAHYCPRTGRRETQYDGADVSFRGEARGPSGATASFLEELRRAWDEQSKKDVERFKAAGGLPEWTMLPLAKKREEP